MDERIYKQGARVVSLDGQDVGTVEDLTGTGSEAQFLVRLIDGDRTMLVPYQVIDAERSTEDMVVIQGAVGDLLDTQMDLGEHEKQTFALSAEEAVAHVHEVDRGRVLIDKTVELVPHEAQIEVGNDRIEVERVAVNEEVDTPPETRQEGETLVVPVVEEVLVVTKRYRIIEEVRVTKHRDITTETFQEELRREVVTVTEEDVEGNVVER